MAIFNRNKKSEIPKNNDPLGFLNEYGKVDGVNMYNFIQGGYIMKRSVRELSEREREEILELGMNKKRGEINLLYVIHFLF